MCAARASSPSYKASRVVAYFMLVAGMGQVALGLAQAWLAEGQPSPGLVATEAISFNVAIIAILVDTLLISSVLVDASGGLFIIALAIFLWGHEPLPAITNGCCTGFRF